MLSFYVKGLGAKLIKCLRKVTKYKTICFLQWFNPGGNNTLVVMKRKFKQWWLTILQISTKRTIISHFKSLNTKRPPHIMTLDIQVLTWDSYRYEEGI